MDDAENLAEDDKLEPSGPIQRWVSNVEPAEKLDCEKNQVAADLTELEIASKFHSVCRERSRLQIGSVPIIISMKLLGSGTVDALVGAEVWPIDMP